MKLDLNESIIECILHMVIMNERNRNDISGD